MKTIHEIIVLFKTHLDLGFTDFAENVAENYVNEYIPNAIRIAEALRGQDEGFIWTTGSWLIQHYFETSSTPQLMEDAIRKGLIRWHALPFTTHTEFMDEALFRYGLSLSQTLDARFQKTTIAAKMTDVPGHTKSMIPLLEKAGVRFLHIGVNPASARPNVPNLFRWRAENGKEIVVMYNNDYGELTPIGESGTAVYFGHTGDNHGPQSVAEINAIYAELHQKYPQAALRAGTLEDVAVLACKEKELPIVTSEIGDTWIHGTGADPHKTSSYRALLRYAKSLPPETAAKLYHELLPVPEHTWGLDEKTHLGKPSAENPILGEHDFFVRKEFEAVRSTPKFQKMEASWDEQRRYLQNAVTVLVGSKQAEAARLCTEYRRSFTDLTGYTEQLCANKFQVDGYTVSVNATGALTYLSKGGTQLIAENGSLGAFVYEVFSEQEYQRFYAQYSGHSEDWAKEDFTKIGMSKAVAHAEQFLPCAARVYSNQNSLVVRMDMPQRGTALYGCPAQAELFVRMEDDCVEFDFAWSSKSATRVAEAMWLGFTPAQNLTAIHKLGAWINPFDVVENGARKLHAVDFGANFDGIELQTLDTPLLTVGEPSLLDFNNDMPKANQGVYFNLFNNVWGTNFPMWYEEDARFRFLLKL